jgi:energy-coupling factor transport system permease protein
MYLYQDAKTAFHLLHPVSKLLALFFLITIAFFINTPVPAFVLLLLYAMLLILAGGSKNLMRFLKLLVLFWVFTFLIWIIVPKLRHVPWSYANAAVLASRIDVFVLGGLFFVTITRIEEFTRALTRIGVPYKGAFALSLGFRLVPLFYQNLQTIVAAQKSRGVDLDSGGMIEKAKKYIPIFGILISYGIRNADLMAMSLEAKGFGYSPKRSYYLQPRITYRDYVFAAIAVAVLVLLLR